MITVSRENNPFKTIIGHVENQGERRELFAVIRTTMERSLKDSAEAKGGRKFWRELANSVSGESDADSAIIGATHPAAAIRQYGGTISAPGKGPGATGAKFLAIPVYPAAEGKSPREINGLFRVANYLIKDLASGETELFYVLKKSVEHPADPWVTPENKRASELRAAACAWLDSRKRN
jgi:phage gpG-like protein